MRPWLPLVAVLALLAGCGGGGDGGDPAASSEEAAVMQALMGANETFARGQYAATCSHYTPSIQEEMIAMTGAETCPEAWATIGKAIGPTLSAAQFDDLTGYVAEEVEIDGDTATATYGEPPESLRDVFGPIEGTSIELRLEDGRWRIASLPGAQGAEPAASPG